MKRVQILAYPYVEQFGRINIPDDIAPEDIENYIIENWDEIDFLDPEIFYQGIDFDICGKGEDL